MRAPNFITIGVGSDKTFQMQLLQGGAPFDLTNVSEISASFPAPNGGKIVETKTGGRITVLGQAGAGRIQITTPGQDTFQMLANPFPPQLQDLQVIVTLSGVSQVDRLTIPSSIVVGQTYSVTIEGVAFSYIAIAGDTDLSVLTQLQTLIAQNPPNVSAGISGGVGTAVLTLTATIPALGFTDVVSSNINKSNITPNSGTRAQFVLKSVLDIVDQPYPLT